MENCIICNSNYKKSYKSDHINSIGHQEKLNQYYLYMFIDVIYICPYHVKIPF